MTREEAIAEINSAISCALMGAMLPNKQYLKALEALSILAPTPRTEPSIDEFVREVERRAEINMLKTGKLEGSHYAAMKQYQAELSALPKGGCMKAILRTLTGLALFIGIMCLVLGLLWVCITVGHSLPDIAKDVATWVLYSVLGFVIVGLMYQMGKDIIG